MKPIREPQRILILSALFPPFVLGGAEISSFNVVKWLVGQGHDVAVLTTAPTPGDEVWGKREHGATIYRVHMPRAYTMLNPGSPSPLAKIRWHWQDHFARFNRRLVRRVISDFRPDLVNPKIVQGLGYNMLGEIGRAGLPVVYSLHDLGLGCLNMGRYRNNRECTGHCAPCRVSAAVKLREIAQIERLSFVSPSRANLEAVAGMIDIADRPGYAIANPNRYPAPTRLRTHSHALRVIYVGRVHASKGVDVVIEALAPLAEHHAVEFIVVGGGPDEAALRSRTAALDWVRFTGHVTVEEVSNEMGQADLLVVPSLWKENSPGVILQAQAIGLPVLASRTGGIPELIEEGVDGGLLPPGDVVEWRNALNGFLIEPDKLVAMREQAEAAVPMRSPERRAAQLWDVFASTTDPAAPTPHLTPREKVFPR